MINGIGKVEFEMPEENSRRVALDFRSESKTQLGKAFSNGNFEGIEETIGGFGIVEITQKEWI